MFKSWIAILIMFINKKYRNSNPCFGVGVMAMHQNPDGQDRIGVWYYIFAVLTVFFVYGYMFYMYI